MEQRSLHHHLSAERLGRALSRPEQGTDLGGQHSPAPVVLEGDLAAVHPETVGGRRIEDLLDLLKLDEVIAGPDRPEPHARHLDDQPWQLARGPGHTPVRLDLEPPGMLDPVEVRRIQPEAFNGERAPFDGAP
jgi:hypothetical protein